MLFSAPTPDWADSMPLSSCSKPRRRSRCRSTSSRSATLSPTSTVISSSCVRAGSGVELSVSSRNAARTAPSMDARASVCQPVLPETSQDSWPSSEVVGASVDAAWLSSRAWDLPDAMCFSSKAGSSIAAGRSLTAAASSVTAASPADAAWFSLDAGASLDAGWSSLAAESSPDAAEISSGAGVSVDVISFRSGAEDSLDAAWGSSGAVASVDGSRAADRTSATAARRELMSSSALESSLLARGDSPPASAASSSAWSLSISARRRPFWLHSSSLAALLFRRMTSQSSKPGSCWLSGLLSACVS
mmetsp:Transcript_87897/g.151806  ORF Transcript_87897/g.151806 Transcript_87897/m.151806 type:complete len:304 (+) Transcript_87897:1542-2453(+)